jgi:hypothetical protein
MEDTIMSISPIMKGDTPLMSFSFATDSESVVSGLPSSPSGYVVWIHDSASVRPGAGTISNINTTAGTCQYQSTAADTANTGVATWWVKVDLGTEPNPRDFDPQKLLIEDPAQA